MLLQAAAVSEWVRESGYETTQETFFTLNEVQFLHRHCS